MHVLDRFRKLANFQTIRGHPKKHISKLIPVDFSGAQTQTTRNAVEVEVTDEELPATRGLALYLVASAVRLGLEDLHGNPMAIPLCVFFWGIK